MMSIADDSAPHAAAQLIFLDDQQPFVIEALHAVGTVARPAEEFALGHAGQVTLTLLLAHHVRADQEVAARDQRGHAPTDEGCD